MQNELRDAAIEYAKQGFAVFPLKPRNKTPMQAGGFKIATTDQRQIEKWWRDTPTANIGIATGQRSGGIVVIDLDVDDNKGIMKKILLVLKIQNIYLKMILNI